MEESHCMKTKHKPVIIKESEVLLIIKLVMPFRGGIR